VTVYPDLLGPPKQSIHVDVAQKSSARKFRAEILFATEDALFNLECTYRAARDAIHGRNRPPQA
jgi:hypothetical protein